MVYFMLYLYTMKEQKSHKLNSLLNSWPQGTVVVSSWLKKQGISAQLAKQYQRSGLMQSIGYGGFIRQNDKVFWTGGLYALQMELGLFIHAGGRTALQIHGEAHNLPLGPGFPVFLFGNRRWLPNWFKNYTWGTVVNNVYTNFLPYKERVGLTSKNFENYSIELSTRELAMFEVLYLVGQQETYRNALDLMEVLNTLRPSLVQELLERCESIKVKRLFMHLAEFFHHPWVDHVNLSKVDFGKGKRVIESGGYFDNKYNISVPRVNKEA